MQKKNRFFKSEKLPLKQKFFEFNVKPSLAGLFSEKCPQKALQPFWEKVQN